MREHPSTVVQPLVQAINEHADGDGLKGSGIRTQLTFFESAIISERPGQDAGQKYDGSYLYHTICTNDCSWSRFSLDAQLKLACPPLHSSSTSGRGPPDSREQGVAYAGSGFRHFGHSPPYMPLQPLRCRTRRIRSGPNGQSPGC